MKTILASTVLTGVAAVASAGVGVETYGTAAPPSTVNGVPVTAAPFRSDIFADTTSTPIGPGGVTATFSSPVSVRQIGLGWASWSHGYAGNVFYTNGATSITMTLSPNVGAFQFYAEPNPFGVWNITASGSDGKHLDLFDPGRRGFGRRFRLGLLRHGRRFGRLRHRQQRHRLRRR